MKVLVRIGLVLLGIFFDLVTCVLITVAIALLWPGTPFDVIWLLQPDRQLALMPYRLWLGPLFLLFVVPATLASYGFFQRKDWARQLAIAIFAANALGDVVQIARGHTLEGMAGVLITGALVFFLLSPPMRAAFED